MTTYKDIRGTHIKTVTADPPAPVSGQMWYNSTTKIMKGFTENPAGAWSSGGNLPGNLINQGAFGGRDAVTTAGAAGGGPPPWKGVILSLGSLAGPKLRTISLPPPGAGGGPPPPAR